MAVQSRGRRLEKPASDTSRIAIHLIQCMLSKTKTFSSKLRRCAALLCAASFALCAQAADLTVSAAASLTNVFKELGPAFEAQNRGATVIFNFGASDGLMTQIAKGAPVDVFASADEQLMDRAEAQKLVIPGSRRNFVSNSLVMIVPVDSALGLKALVDLRRPEVKRVAIGNPASVPVGRYAKTALQAVDLWTVVESKAVTAQTPRQALDYVARGEVEAGLVYSTDAAVMKDKVKIAANVAIATPILYPIAVVNQSPNGAVARRFIEFLRDRKSTRLNSSHVD